MTYMADLIGFGEKTDILPFAIAALNEFPTITEITPFELSELCDTFCHRRLPKNAFPALPNDVVEMLIWRIWRRVSTSYRITQIDDTDVRRFRSFVDFTFEKVLCQQASELTGRFHTIGTLVVLPVYGCEHRACLCTYRTRSIRDLAREGRLSDDGQPLPLQKCSPTPPI
jgi:hypothetical protein